MAFTDSILVRLGLDNAAFNRGLEGANQGVKRMQTAFKAFAGLAVVGAFKRMVDHARELGDTLGTLSATTGVAASTIQTLRQATIVAGGSAGEADKSISRFNRTIGDAIVKGGETRIAFDALGVSLKDADGNARKTEEVLNDVANALSQIDNMAVRAGIASKLFGEQSIAFTDAISKGADEIARLKKELEETGGILTDLQVRELDRFDKVVKKSTESAGKSFARFVGNWLTNVNVLGKSLSDVDFWKSFTGDENANARWKKRIDAFLFGSQMISDAQREAMIVAEKNNEMLDRERRMRESIVKIIDRQVDALKRVEDAQAEKEKAVRGRVLFGSLEELAGADVSRGATRQMLAQRAEAKNLMAAQGRVGALKNAGLVDLADVLQGKIDERMKSLTLLSDAARNPFSSMDERIEMLQEELRTKADEITGILKESQEYTGTDNP